jgi:hypothetical protein
MSGNVLRGKMVGVDEEREKEQALLGVHGAFAGTRKVLA